MRKCFTLAAVIVLVALVAVPLSGCGGDAGQAKQYMQQGDELAGQFKQEATSWAQGIQSAFDTPASQEEFRDTSVALTRTAEEAKAAYEKIGSLEGVEDYAGYADIQVERLDIFLEFIALTSAYFDRVVTMMNSSDVTDLQSVTDEYLAETERLGEEIDGLEQEARKLKEDKNL